MFGRKVAVGTFRDVVWVCVKKFILKVRSIPNLVYMLSKGSCVRCLKLSNIIATILAHMLLRIYPKCAMFAISLLQYCSLYEYLCSEYLLHARYILRKKYLRLIKLVNFMRKNHKFYKIVIFDHIQMRFTPCGGLTKNYLYT